MKGDADLDLSRLCLAMQRSRMTLRYFREERREAVRQYVGKHWSEEGAKERVPVNLLAQYVNIVGDSLVPHNPRAMLSTFQRQFKPIVGAMQDWVNRELPRQHFSTTLKRVVIDALFSIGVMKVALATPADAASFNWKLKAGEPFCERVDLDDFVFDVHARDFSEVTYIGHRIRVPLEAVKDSKIYGKSRKDLHPTEDRLFNLEGDERISVMGRGIYGLNYDEFEDHVDLWEIYLPRHRLVVTLSDDQVTGAILSGREGVEEALLVQRWLGHDDGPYAILGFGLVPGNAMPKAPIQDLFDLHLSVNNIFRKLLRQAENQKQVGLASRAATEDGNRIIQASDGEIIGVDDPKNMSMMTFNGPSNELFLFGTQLRQIFSWLAGNLDVQGGLEPQSKTLGQDKMLNENSSRQTTSLQDEVTAHATQVLKRLCWYWHHHPFQVQQSAHKVQDMTATRTVTPQMRGTVPFDSMDIKIDPYSMPHQTPQSRLAALNQIMQGIITPLMPILQQQGISIDINAYLGKVATYLDQPDLTDVVTIQEPVQQQGGGLPDTPKMPQETTRNYVRESRPGRTQQGNEMNMISSLAGVNPGGAQRNGQAGAA